VLADGAASQHAVAVAEQSSLCLPSSVAEPRHTDAQAVPHHLLSSAGSVADVQAFLPGHVSNGHASNGRLRLMPVTLGGEAGGAGEPCGEPCCTEEDGKEVARASASLPPFLDPSARDDRTASTSRAVPEPRQARPGPRGGVGAGRVAARALLAAQGDARGDCAVAAEPAGVSEEGSWRHSLHSEDMHMHSEDMHMHMHMQDMHSEEGSWRHSLHSMRAQGARGRGPPPGRRSGGAMEPSLSLGAASVAAAAAAVADAAAGSGLQDVLSMSGWHVGAAAAQAGAWSGEVADWGLGGGADSALARLRPDLEPGACLEGDAGEEVELEARAAALLAGVEGTDEALPPALLSQLPEGWAAEAGEAAAAAARARRARDVAAARRARDARISRAHLERDAALWRALAPRAATAEDRQLSGAIIRAVTWPQLLELMLAAERRHAAPRAGGGSGGGLAAAQSLGGAGAAPPPAGGGARAPVPARAWLPPLPHVLPVAALPYTPQHVAALLSRLAQLAEAEGAPQQPPMQRQQQQQPGGAHRRPAERSTRAGGSGGAWRSSQRPLSTGGGGDARAHAGSPLHAAFVQRLAALAAALLPSPGLGLRELVTIYNALVRYVRLYGAEEGC
jgi:hypothetical protein